MSPKPVMSCNVYQPGAQHMQSLRMIYKRTHANVCKLCNIIGLLVSYANNIYSCVTRILHHEASLLLQLQPRHPSVQREHISTPLRSLYNIEQCRIYNKVHWFVQWGGAREMQGMACKCHSAPDHVRMPFKITRSRTLE